MEFSIGAQFSREFTFEESSIAIRLSDELNVYFNDKDYGDKIKKIYVGVICVSKGFDSFFMARKPKFLKEESALELEFKLDFKTFQEEEESNRRKIIAKELLKSIEGIISQKKIKNFKEEKFKDDLKDYFENQNYFV